jgi:hypothetical protein
MRADYECGYAAAFFFLQYLHLQGCVVEYATEEVSWKTNWMKLLGKLM